MTLEDRLKSLIQETGPIPLSVWMTHCLHDRAEGYYATQPGLGRDFITAPETSQIFGELLGLWANHEWQAMDKPDRFVLAEAGPGRGTLMADALRAAGTGPGFIDALDLQLIEASPALRIEQARRLSNWQPSWIDRLEALPDAPTILIANEFLDCLPARQFHATPTGWHEQLISLDDTGNFVLGLSPLINPAPDMPNPSPGTVIEYQPGLEALTLALADIAKAQPLRALFIDYGPANGRPGDTLRAYHQGEQISPLSRPGKADLTVDVDFSQFRHHAETAGLRAYGPVPQGAFLLALGAQERLNQLTNRAPDKAEELFDGAEKLIAEQHMGLRFKAICLSSPGLPPPAGFSSESQPYSAG